MLDIFIILCVIIILLFFKRYILSAILFIIILIFAVQSARKKSYVLSTTYKPSNIIRRFNYYIDINESYEKIVSMIKEAKTRIIYSCFACNLDALFYQNNDMKSLLNEAASRGVDIRIFYNTTSEYTNHSIQDLQQRLDQRIHITTITSEAQITEQLQPLLKQITYSYNHQKFLICDNIILFGGCDIDPWERKGYNIINKNNFYWHEIAVSFDVPETFISWLIQFRNLQSCMVGNMPPPPPPFINKRYEINTMLYMIRHSNNILYIEHQLLAMSNFSDILSQSIITAIADRLTRSCQNNDDVQICIITNVSQDDEYNVFTQFFSSNTLNLAICNILNHVPSKLRKIAKNKLQIFRLLNGSSNIKVHSNIMISDDSNNNYHLIRTSSNLSDRSFGNYPCDIELGIYIQGDQVRDLYKQLVKLHTNGSDTISETGFLQRIDISCSNELIRSSALFVTQTHPATGHCTHNMLIENVQ